MSAIFPTDCIKPGYYATIKRKVPTNVLMPINDEHNNVNLKKVVTTITEDATYFDDSAAIVATTVDIRDDIEDDIYDIEDVCEVEAGEEYCMEIPTTAIEDANVDSNILPHDYSNSPTYDISIAEANQRFDKLQRTLFHVERQVLSLQGEKRNLQRKYDRLKARTDKEITGMSMRDAIEGCALCLNKRGGIITKIIAKAALEAFNGLAKDELVMQCKAILQATIYSPFNIARVMDLSGGTINLSCIELLQLLKTKGRKHYQGSLLPSSGAIKRVFAAAKQLGDVCVPYTILN